MATTRTALTDEDIRALIKGPTADDRAIAAHKICRSIDRVDLTPEERTRAHESCGGWRRTRQNWCAALWP